MKIKRAVLAPIVVAVIALATGGWLLQQGASREGNVYTQARLFEEVLHHISDRYVEPKDPATLYRMAIDGLLYELGDPHTVFMTPEDYSDLRIHTQGEYGGIGAEIAKRDGWITIVSPLPDSPAERAGLQAGDKIVEINGTSTKDWSTDEAVHELRGPQGDAVDIRVARLGVDQLIPFRLVRAEIHIEAIRTSYLVEEGIGYIDLRLFSETTTDELRAAIDALRAQGMRGLVLDLRRNPGGLLDQAISASDLFLDAGAAVSELRGRVAQMNQKFVASGSDHYPGMPVVVLIGPSTASASEILAGALQDHDRALIMGRTSFGKGSVQTLYQLPAGHYLKMTTARWYTPVGRSIQRPHDADESVAAGNGEDTAAVPDGVETAEREVYHTDSGRTVYGGGGITPDLVVEPEKLSERELEFARAVQKHGSKFSDLLYDYAYQFVHDHPSLERGFPVTPELLDGFFRTLNENGIEVERSLFDAANRWVGQSLVFEITYAKWSRGAAQQRANREDAQVQAAVELLRAATDPQSLFAVASRYETQHPEPAGARSARGEEAPAGARQP